MKAVLLDGSFENDGTGARVHGALMAELEGQGWESERIVLRDKEIGPCAGDFFCWIRTPGTCMLDDDNRAIVAEVARSDLLVFLTPVTFGGYSSALKSIVDHLIQNISPYFTKVEGETHHRKRYDAYADLLVVGWMQAPDAQAERVFRHLARRNALNFRAPEAASQVLLADHSDEEMRASLRTYLSNLGNGGASQPVELPDSGRTPAPAMGGDYGVPEIQRAMLLVGSPKTAKSTSYLLGEYLLEKMSEQSIQTETAYVHTAVRAPEKVEALLEAVDAADLVMLAFPLYVDSLPAPAIEVMEAIAARRRGREGAPRQRFVAIANCGFPEAFHNRTALAICESFARQAGFLWAGSLSMGGGRAMGAIAPLSEASGRVETLKEPLDLAAKALGKGQHIPEAAQELLAKPLTASWLYRLIGNMSWPQQAKRWGAQKLLRQKPYVPDGA